MNKKTTFALAIALAVPSFTLVAQETDKSKASPAKASAVSAEKPDTKPQWTVVEEEFWYPLRYEPLYSLDAARSRFRINEEKSAAREIQKAAGWMSWASSHATPETKQHLLDSATELKAVAKELQSGSAYSAQKMDSALSRSAHSLANWHLTRAKSWWGNKEMKYAGDDLVLAANYLQQAANSAHIQFGPDAQQSITQVFENGKYLEDIKHTDHNWVAMNIEGVEGALREVATALKK